MSGKSDKASGVKVFSIGGRMVNVRERCMGMTDEERRWRAQFLKDQILSPEEPRFVPELYKDTNNIFRRLWKTPLWTFQKFLDPIVGPDYAYGIRHFVGKAAIFVSLIYLGTYYVKYAGNDFTADRCVETFAQRPRMYPDDPGYPNYGRSPQEYFDLGFYSSPLAVKVEKPTPPPPPSRIPTKSSGIICAPAED